MFAFFRKPTDPPVSRRRLGESVLIPRTAVLAGTTGFSLCRAMIVRARGAPTEKFDRNVYTLDTGTSRLPFRTSRDFDE